MSIYDKPKVTVLISTFNRPQYLAEAIESVVNQRFQNWELIVLNDGGVDVREVVDKFADPRIIYVPDDVNKGAARRFNQGLSLARGEYVTYLGDDDLFYPNHVEVLAKALDEHPEVALAYSDLYAASSIADRKTGKRYVLDRRISVSRGFNREFMFHFNHVLHVSLMHRLDAAKRVGCFDENVKVLIEWSLNRRLAFLYDFYHVEEVTGEYHMAVFKSDRISVRERRNTESYKHNLRKIRCNFPAEPWNKVERIDMLYPVDEWGPKLNQHLREIIDSFDHPFKICLINNGTNRTPKEIEKSLGNLMELKSISIMHLSQKESNPLMACRHAAKKSNARYLFLVSPKLAAVKSPKRLFATLQFLAENPQHKAVRWQVEEEAGSPLDCLIEREYFIKNSKPGKYAPIHLSAITIGLAKGFKFDAMFTKFKEHRKKKEWKECRRLIDDILKETAGFPHIQYLIHYLAPVCLAQKDYATLEKELRALIDRGYRSDNLIRLGYMYSQQGRYPEAVETLKEALAEHGLTEDDFEADCFPFDRKTKLSVFHLFIALAGAYLELNDPGQAARYYHLASKMATSSHVPFLGFAKVYMLAGQLDRAEVALQKLPVKGGQEDPETHRILGKLCQKRRNLELAFGCYSRAFELAPADEKNVDPYYFVGASLGRWEEMYNTLSTFSHQNPESVIGLARLAAVSFQLKNETMAADMADRCLELDPANPIAKSIRSRIIKNAETAPMPAAEAIIDVGGLRLDMDIAPIAW
ncbi:MAG: glycosyltransferase [Candidatus Adiutrix sp.]|jgi:glycosyltransferase involved in cell wall biosynthesis/Tfp pilus assembly protein PilF|nr:glycosyltransferase [Candidatus Adiutrix sp.]